MGKIKIVSRKNPGDISFAKKKWIIRKNLNFYPTWEGEELSSNATPYKILDSLTKTGLKPRGSFFLNQQNYDEFRTPSKTSFLLFFLAFGKNKCYTTKLREKMFFYISVEFKVA